MWAGGGSHPPRVDEPLGRVIMLSASILWPALITGKEQQ